MQLKKVAAVCNTCFWLTLFFQYWRLARNIHAEILGTIVILGVMSVLVNLCWLVQLAAKPKETQSQDVNEAAPVKNEAPAKGQLLKWFNILSFAVQIICLYLKYL